MWVTANVTLPRTLVEAIHEHTSGNPLFVTEVVRLLAPKGELTHEGVGTRKTFSLEIPNSVREVIRMRLNGLSQHCYQTLSLASVIGRKFSREQLNHLVEDMSESRLLEALEEGLGSHAIEELPSSVGRYQFTHALIQKALLEGLGIGRRGRLHARIGEVPEEMHGTNAEAHAAELAYHFTRAYSAIGGERLVHYSLLAGERALASCGYEEAASYFERALVSKEDQPTDADTAALLLGLGRAQVAIVDRTQMKDSVANLGRAFDCYHEVGDLDRAVSVALELPGPPVALLSEVPRLLYRALMLFPPDSQAGRLLCHYGNILALQECDDEAAQHAFRLALDISHGEGYEALEMRTLVNSGRNDAFHLRWQESLEKCLHAIELARRLDDTRSLVPASFWAVHSLAVMGDLGTAKGIASAALASAERLRHRYWLCVALDANGVMARLEGDWQAAREYTDRGLTVTNHQLRFAFQRSMLEYEVGNFDEGESYLKFLMEGADLSGPRVPGEFGVIAVAVPMVARISGVTTHFDVAESAAEITLSSSFATPLYTVVARAGLGLIAVARGDGAAAQEQYAALESERDTMFLRVIVTERLLGLLAHTMGEAKKAVQHFENSLAFCRNADYLPEFAWSCCDYADTLLERDAAGDREHATSLLRDSLKISRGLGMRPLMERVLFRQETLTT